MIPAISLAYETREADIMARPPRDNQKDHLVDFNLLWFTYLHFGVLQVRGQTLQLDLACDAAQALAGFYAFEMLPTAHTHQAFRFLLCVFLRVFDESRASL